MDIKEIAQNIRTQDNRITSFPIFCVQQKRRDYGYDPDLTDAFVWIDGRGEEANEEDRAECQKRYEGTGDGLDDWTRTGYVDRWEFVTACFTQAGADAFIAANGHNLRETRVFVESGYRNQEWIAVRDHLAKL